MKPQTETIKRDTPQAPQKMTTDQTQRQPSEYEETAPERRQPPTDTLPEATQTQTEGSFQAGPGTPKPVPQGDETETETVIGDRPERADQAYELNQPKNTH